MLTAVALSLVLLAQAPLSVRAADASVTPAQVAATERQARNALAELVPRFPGLRAGPVEIVLHADRSSLPAEVRRSLHEGTAGVALLGRQQIHLILDAMRLYPPHDPRTVIEHELIHLLLDQYVGEAGPWVPRWLHEGLAQVMSGHTYLGASEEDIVFHARIGRLPGFHHLRERFPDDTFGLRIAYAQSFSFVSFLMSRIGLRQLLAVAAGCGPDVTFDDAFLRQTGVPLVEVEEEWLEYVKTGSGAAFRVLLTSCFGLLMVAALPLLVLAGVRKWNRDHRSRMHLEAEAAASAEGPSAEGPSADGADRSPPGPDT